MERGKRYHTIERQTDNRFLNLYHINAIDREGNDFDYYFASRNDESHIKIRTGALEPEGIVIYAATEEESPRLVLIRQYRYPVGDYIYELPAGLIDAGETAGEAAGREMKEETGLDFTEYTGGRPFYRRPFFMGQGFTDETSAAVFGTVTGAPSGAYMEASEDIEVLFADRKKVEEILAAERVSLRGAYLMMQFLHSDGPFGFLD